MKPTPPLPKRLPPKPQGMTWDRYNAAERTHRGHRDVVGWLAFLLGGCRTYSFASSHASHSVLRQWFRLTSGCPSASMRKR
jgi:hypothetical protein